MEDDCVFHQFFIFYQIVYAVSFLLAFEISKVDFSLLVKDNRIHPKSYPTVRLQLDKLIQKIRISENGMGDPYIALVKRLAANHKLDFQTAKILISAYKKTKGLE